MKSGIRFLSGLRPCWAAGLAVWLTACGGGGGIDGGGGGDSAAPVAPQPVVGSRQASIQYDFDNDGSVDAVETAGYDASGRYSQTRYRYSGDTQPDRFNPVGTGPVDEDVVYDAAGRMLQYTVAQDGGSTRFSFVYGTDGRAERADLSMSSGGRNFSGQRLYDRANGVLQQVRSVLDGQTLSTDTYGHDANGRRNRLAESSDTGTPLVTDYVWNADGSLAEVRRDFDADGSNVRYTMTYVAGLQTRTVKTVGGLPFYTVDFVRDAQGRVTQARFDHGSNGSVDAVWTVTWEAGACSKLNFPDFDPLLDSVTGLGSSAIGQFDPCGP